LHLTTATSGSAFRLECSTNDASSGGDLTIYRRRGATAAGQDNDLLGTVYYRGRNDDSTGAAEVDFASIEGSISDASDGSEDGRLRLKVQNASTMTTQLTIEPTGTTFAENITITDAKNIVLNTSTGTKIGTATSQKLGLWNVTPVVQPSAIANITTTASSGTLPTPNAAVTIANAASPTNVELLEYCVELESKLEATLAALRAVGVIAT
jgi:hypothetical protein